MHGYTSTFHGPLESSEGVTVQEVESIQSQLWREASVGLLEFKEGAGFGDHLSKINNSRQPGRGKFGERIGSFPWRCPSHLVEPPSGHSRAGAGVRGQGSHGRQPAADPSGPVYGRFVLLCCVQLSRMSSQK